jgi:1-acyl-sn-glycerol-3-phosphate acyltransferase
MTRILYATYVWSIFLLLGLTTTIVMLLIPGLLRRRQLARLAARSVLTLAGMPLTVKNLAHLPIHSCVVVANHASYLDGLVMTAALPPRFAFVIKREMASVPLAGFLLKRLGAEFVERFNRARGALDTRRILRNATSGGSLVFFPEGTFSPRPGLLKFHKGAFLTAERAQCQVLPAVLRGTRYALAPTTAFPRPGPIEVEFLQPLQPTENVREQARAAILQELNEPDLSTTA